MIITRTPFRISFLGGGTDYPAYYHDHIGMVLGATIDKYCYLTLDYQPRFIAPRYRLIYSQVEEVERVEDIQHRGVRGTLEYLGIKHPLELYHASDLPSQSGMGSSSAFVVGLLNALSGTHWTVDPEKGGSRCVLSEAATTIEQDILHEPVGSQDQILTALGGINQIIWHPRQQNVHQEGVMDWGPVIRPIQLSPERIKELESHLLLLYTGLRQPNPYNIYTEDWAADPPRDNTTRLQTLANMVKDGVKILTSNDDINRFGYLLHESWQIKKELADNITTPRIDVLYQYARQMGASGGKLLGSGGGGFMLLFARPQYHAAILDCLSHLTHVPFQFEFEGSKVIHAN